jgi:hypothetical protein
MSLRETYYMKFDNEIERQAFKEKICSSPYYLSHYCYERDAVITPNEVSLQYMICVDIGNFVPTARAPITGEHKPIPLFDEAPNEDDSEED